MLLTIAAILIVLWLLGVIVHVGGGLIHILIIAAVIAFLYHVLVGRRD